MPGSNGLVRTKSFGVTEENEAHQQAVHIAIVYQEDGTITGYRNGVAVRQTVQDRFSGICRR